MPPRLPEDPLARFTDSYFLKTKAIVGAHGDKRATYAVFLRRPVIATPRLMVEFVERAAKDRGVKFDIELNHKEGEWVGAGEPMVYLSGSLYHLVDLETLYLQKLGPPCVAAYNAYAMCADLPEDRLPGDGCAALRRIGNGRDDGLCRVGRIGGGEEGGGGGGLHRQRHRRDRALFRQR